MNNLFLTGEMGIGKSTLLKNTIEKMDVSVGGYITERNFQDNVTSFTVKSLNDGIQEHVIAKVNTKDKRKEIFTDSFEIGLTSILNNSLEDRELTVMDELGFMENALDVFTSKVYELLDSEKPVFGVLKDYDCEFLNNIKNRKDVTILKVTKENRDTISNEIMEILKSFGLDFKRENSFMWSKKRIDWYNEALDHPKSDYPNFFIGEIKKYVGTLEDKTVIDIGAGTGAFAIPLMEEGAYVTAVDSSFNMLNSLSARAKEKRLDNFKYIISPFERIQPEKHSIAISAFSGGGTKTLEGIKKMQDAVEDYAFIISSFEKQENNFKKNVLYKMLNRPLKKKKRVNNSLANTLKDLDTYGYSYEYKEIKYEFSQYFNDFSEMLDYFIDKYNIRISEEVRITEEFIKKFSTKIDNQYKFENIKESWIIIIKSESNK